MKKPILLHVIFCFLFTLLSHGEDVNKEWVKTFSNRNITKNSHVAVDSHGYIYLAGTQHTSSQGENWALVKLGPSKDTVFVKSLNDTIDGDDYVNAIAIDKNDNIYVTGRFETGSNESSATTFKISKTGIILWQANYSLSSGINEAMHIVPDDSGNVYVAGNYTDSTNYDSFIIKYDSTGTKSWDYNLTTSSSEFIRAMKLCPNGNLAIAYDTKITYEWCFSLLNLDTGGNLIFNENFGGRGSTDRQCNDMIVDADNNIYLTGYEYNDDTKDFVTVKYDETGDQIWFALFDERSTEDEAIGLEIAGDLLIVTGKSGTLDFTELVNNITTIAYSLDGVQQWKQTYDGAAKDDDYPIAIAKNGSNNVILIANVKATTTAYESVVLNYSSGGELMWSQNYYFDAADSNAIVSNVAFAPDTLSGNTMATDVVIDFLGNIYVAFNYSDTSNTTSNVIKFNQPPKCLPVLKNYLEQLTVGLLDISSDTIVKSIFYESCSQAVDSFYHITYQRLIDQCALRSIDLKAAINSSIANYYSLPSYNYVDYIFEHFRIMGHLVQPFIAVPNFNNFDSTDLGNNPKLAYAYEEDNFPLTCLNCSGGIVDSATARTTPTWTVVIIPHWFLFSNQITLWKHIGLCTPVTWANASDRCWVCNYVTPGQVANSSSGPMQHHELEIALPANPGDFCYESFNGTPSYPAPTSYAILSKVLGVPNFIPVDPGLVPSGETWLKKTQKPFQDWEYKSYITMNTTHNNNNLLEGNSLTLCSDYTEFNIIGETAERYSIAFGLYKISRPLTNQKPLYFYIPSSNGIWYHDGPDMHLQYGHDWTGNNCTPGNYGEWEIIENNNTGWCMFCTDGPLNVNNITSSNVRDYIASTDASTIYNYWSDCVITVGLEAGITLAGNSGIQAPNSIDFTAVTNPPSPISIPGSPNSICELVLTSNGEYVVKKYINNPLNYNLTPQNGNSVIIKVVANFKNGESIDEWQTLVLQDLGASGPLNPLANVVVNIRGDIKDYSSTVENYHIYFYQ